MARKISQTPAPKKDQIKGSKKNPKGSASGSKKAAKVKFSKSVEEGLKNKVEKHNEKAPKGRKTSISTLKAVYRRGAGAFSVSHRPGMTRNQWAMARVNAFLRLLKSGKPKNSAYTSDNDLLPASHPKSSKKSNSAITASALVPEEQDFANAILSVVQKHGKFNEDGEGVWAGYTSAADNIDSKIGVMCGNCVFFDGGSSCAIIDLTVEAAGKCRLAVIPDDKISVFAKEKASQEFHTKELMVASAYAEKELEVELLKEEDYSSPERAILALTELSGFGYEAEPAIRASWLRAVKNGEDAFKRASLLASLGYESLDGDLLPYTKEEDNQ